MIECKLKHFHGHEGHNNDNVQLKHFQDHPFSRSPVFKRNLTHCNVCLCFEYELNIPFLNGIWSVLRCSGRLL